MKIVILFTLCCGYVLCQTPTTTKDPRDGVRCTRDSECPSAECCVHTPLTIHQKRFIFGDFMAHDHGFCRLNRKENQTCNPLGHDFLNHNLHEFHCPCEAGLECRGTRVHESQHQIMHENPICQQPEI